MNKKRLTTIFAFLLCIGILFTGPYYNTLVQAAESDYIDEDDVDDDSETELKDLNSKYAALEKEQQALQAQVNSAQSEKQKKIAAKKQLDNQIALTKEQIAVLSQRIGLLTSEITDLEEQIANKEEEIDDNYQLFLKRMRVMYMKGDSTMMGLVLGANTFSEFLMQSELVKRLAEHDQELINGLVADKLEIEEAMAKVAENKKAVESDKDTMAQKQTQLDGQVQQTNKEIQDIAAMEQEYMNNLQAKKAEMDQVQAEIAEIYKNIGSIGDYVGGELAWPLPGFTSISSEYGLRFGGNDYHTGIDITGSGVNGKTIVAANSGKVVVAQNTFVAGKGYGRYLMIDHGGGLTTIYAHTSQLLVGLGEMVVRGQAIAKVGSTGWSTGPHLHFEVRRDGSHINPWTMLR